MLGFRLREGLDLDALAASYGDLAVRRVEAGVAEGLHRGWVVREVGNERGGKISGITGSTAPAVRGSLRLSDPDGFLFSNSVISSVFCELQDFSRERKIS